MRPIRFAPAQPAYFEVFFGAPRLGGWPLGREHSERAAAHELALLEGVPNRLRGESVAAR